MARQTAQQVVDDAVRQAMQSQTVRRALRNRANRILPRAQRTAYEAGATAFGDALEVEEGTRPGAKAEGGAQRPYARVVAEVDEDMSKSDARARLTRVQILRRSARA